MMSFASCRHLPVVALIVYCGVAVLVIVNGQSTTDDDIDKDEIIRRDTVEALRAELREEFREELRAALTAERAKSADAINSLKSQIAKLENKGKGKNSHVLLRPNDDSRSDFIFYL